MRPIFSSRSLPLNLSHRTAKAVLKGREYPLGATVVEGGVNFALYSRSASAVYLLLFDRLNAEPTGVIQLQNRDKFNFITCHDGFTLYDLVSYNGKHNKANGENYNDGSNDTILGTAVPMATQRTLAVMPTLIKVFRS